MKKYDKIWDICRNVASSNGNKLTGLRDLFDPHETTYIKTDLFDKIEIISLIRKKTNCSFKEIADAFLDYYDNESYQHIIPAYPYAVFLLLGQVSGHNKNKDATPVNLEEITDLLCNETCESESDIKIKVNTLLDFEKNYLELAFTMISKKNKKVLNNIINFAINKIDNFTDI
jgi:hypothetical protein